MTREPSVPRSEAAYVRLAGRACTIAANCDGRETTIYVNGEPALRCAGRITAIWTMGAGLEGQVGCRR